MNFRLEEGGGAVAAIVGTKASEIASLHSEIVGHLRQSLEKAMRIGELLAEQKASMAHGKFTPWIEENLPFTDRTARNYMRLYKERDRFKTETVSDLKSAYRLLKSPMVENAGGVTNEDNKPKQTDLDQLCSKLRRLKKAVQRFSCVIEREKQEKAWGLGCVSIKLKGAKRNFYRSVDDYPGEASEEQLIVWNSYFEYLKIERALRELGSHLYGQLPEELPENRSKPKKKATRFT